MAAGRLVRKPVWALAAARRRGEVVRAGQLFEDETTVLARAGRIDARYAALARAVTSVADDDADPLGPDWRAAWAAHWQAWKAYYTTLRRDGTVYGVSETDELDTWDQELDAYRETFELRTGRDLGTPNSTTGAPRDRGGLEWPSWFGGVSSGAALALGGVALAGLWMLSRSR